MATENRNTAKPAAEPKQSASKKTPGIPRAPHLPAKTPAVKAAAAKAATAKAPAAPHQLDSGRLQLLVTVVNKGKGESTADLLQAFEVNMQLSIRAEGTASTEMLEILGMDNNKKSVVISVIREEKVPEAMAALEKNFARIKDGKGIAFTLPMSSVIGVMLFGFLSNDRRAAKPVQKGEPQ